MFDETDFKHTQWILDSCVADESVTFILKEKKSVQRLKIQENFFEPLIGNKTKNQTNITSVTTTESHVQSEEVRFWCFGLEEDLKGHTLNTKHLWT